MLIFAGFLHYRRHCPVPPAKIVSVYGLVPGTQLLIFRNGVIYTVKFDDVLWSQRKFQLCTVTKSTCPCAVVLPFHCKATSILQKPRPLHQREKTDGSRQVFSHDKCFGNPYHNHGKRQFIYCCHLIGRYRWTWSRAQRDQPFLVLDGNDAYQTGTS